jgi:hypothetical protein
MDFLNSQLAGTVIMTALAKPEARVGKAGP